MKWTETNGREREQFMASEEDFAEFIRLTLPKLQDSGATGAMHLVLCRLRPMICGTGRPARTQWHERFFGLVRPDGSLKPHAKVIQEFAKTNPQVKPIPDYARLTVDPDEFYAEPLPHLANLYEQYVAGVDKFEATKSIETNG